MKEDEISLNKLGNDSFHFSSSEAEESKKEIPKISASTSALIQNLKKTHPAPVITENHGLTTREKHQDLLTTHRSIVIPAKYRALIQLQNFLDMTINFLKSRGKFSEFIPFKEIQSSLGTGQGKFISVNNGRPGRGIL